MIYPFRVEYGRDISKAGWGSVTPLSRGLNARPCGASPPHIRELKLYEYPGVGFFFKRIAPVVEQTTCETCTRSTAPTSLRLPLIRR